MPSATDPSIPHGEYDWEVGFRVGANFQVPCHQWKIGAEYTYFSSDWSRSITGTSLSPSTIGDNGSLLDASGDATSMTSSVDLDYHMFDIVASYACCMCEALELSPYGGFRALYIDQHVVESVLGGTYVAGDGTNVNADMAAYGVTGGLGWTFYTCYPLHLFGHIGASALFGDADIGGNVTSAGATTAVNLDEPCHSTLGVDGAIGLFWQGCAWGLPLNISASYEATHWTDVPNVFSSSKGFGLHGFSGRATLSF